MRKNNMRTSKEKEKILKEFYSGKIGRNEICRKHNISTATLNSWRKKYDKDGLKGLKSNTGKSTGGNKGLGVKKGKTIEENLKLKIMKLEIENARKIVDTRNWVIHGYDKVDDVIIWGIISKHLPKLKEEIEAYL